MPCEIDLVLARHSENVSWAHWSGSICPIVYTTGLAGTTELAVPNTGREALPFLRHILRVAAGAHAPAPVTAFVQGYPHCVADSTGDANCVREFRRRLESLSEPMLAAHGGVVHLGVRARAFAYGLPLPEYRECYVRELAQVAGIAPRKRLGASATTLFAAFSERGWYVPGAQFAVGRAALRGLLARPELHGWVRRAEMLLSAPNMSDSGARGYDMQNCCVPCSDACRARGCLRCPLRRSCLPWLFERLWVTTFALASLLAARDRSIDSQLSPSQQAEALASVLRNASRGELRQRHMLPAVSQRQQVRF